MLSQRILPLRRPPEFGAFYTQVCFIVLSNNHVFICHQRYAYKIVTVNNSPYSGVLTYFFDFIWVVVQVFVSFYSSNAFFTLIVSFCLFFCSLQITVYSVGAQKPDLVFDQFLSLTSTSVPRGHHHHCRWLKANWITVS